MARHQLPGNGRRTGSGGVRAGRSNRSAHGDILGLGAEILLDGAPERRSRLYAAQVANANDLIEQQLFKMLRRTQATHVRTASGEVELARTSYGLLCLPADEAPHAPDALGPTTRR